MAHTGITQLIETAYMTSCKLKMIELADDFIAMPGGLGTYEELFEVLSQAQLQMHGKPIGILNINGFFDALLTMLKQTAIAGFMPEANLNLLCISDDVEDLLKKMEAYQYVHAPKWVVSAWKTALNDE